MRGLCALAVAYEEVDGGDFEAEGNGFELIGLLARNYSNYTCAVTIHIVVSPMPFVYDSCRVGNLTHFVV